CLPALPGCVLRTSAERAGDRPVTALSKPRVPTARAATASAWGSRKAVMTLGPEARAPRLAETQRAPLVAGASTRRGAPSAPSLPRQSTTGWWCQNPQRPLAQESPLSKHAQNQLVKRRLGVRSEVWDLGARAEGLYGVSILVES